MALTLVNSGDTLMTNIGLGASLSGPFTLLDCPSTLAPWQSATIDVAFDPTLLGDFSTTLQMSYFDGSYNQMADFALSGSAVPEPSTFVLLGIGAISLFGYGWRRRNSRRVSDAVSGWRTS
jgi:hypothetical protein